MKKKCNNCKAELTNKLPKANAKDKELCSMCESSSFLDLID